MKLLLILFTTSCLTLLYAQPEDGRKFLKEFKSHFFNLSSLSFDLEVKIINTNHVDSANYSYTCMYERNYDDSIFGNNIWIDSDSMSLIHTLESTSSFHHNTKTQIFYPKGEEYYSPYLQYPMLFQFLTPQKIDQAIGQNNLIIELKQLQQGKTLITLKQKKATYPEMEGSSISYLFSATKDILKFTMRSESSGKKELVEFTYSNYVYNETTFQDFQKGTEKYKDYALLYQTDIIETTLKKGLIAPRFSGKNCNSTNYINSENIENQVIVLLFFDKDIPVSFKSVRALNELHSQFKEEGLNIFGVLGTQEFLTRGQIIGMKIDHVITFPFFKPSSSTLYNYSIYHYPTLIVINKKGEIILLQQGWKENMMEEITKIIVEALHE